ncbi:MAG: FGGY family carbohydrate kinase [Aestuariivirgaceae bacterium]|nr:FGGY family carbohydrate kinase [Aestuariivirgaceae bacterium]
MKPRGILVADVGYTHTKLALFNDRLELVAEEKIASRHPQGPPYPSNDPETAMAFFRERIVHFDTILPVDVIVPCGHGAAVVALDVEGKLVLPPMDYNARPPQRIIAEYERAMPAFAESASPFLPMALMHGMQLFWMSRDWPEAFARTHTIMPWIQYITYRLSGMKCVEITSMCCQSHLMNVPESRLSSLVEDQGWAPFFPPFAKAWQRVGVLDAAFRGAGLRGRAEVVAGIHDSSANFLRYLAGGRQHFSLVSTGTWSIAFDSDTRFEELKEDLDTSANRDVFGNLVSCSRFFGGKEFEILAGSSVSEIPRLETVGELITSKIFALPSFSDSAGPMPGTGDRGRIEGRSDISALERISIASLYCAQMVSMQLDALKSRGDIIIDGPFSQNRVLLGVLAQLRAGQRIFASKLTNGTAAGAAVLALIENETIPAIPLTLDEIAPAGIAGLADYQREWLARAKA